MKIGLWKFPFTSIWDTRNVSDNSSNERQIRLPVAPGAFSQFSVDWGDGTVSDILSATDPNITHTYKQEGVYTISLIAPSLGISFSGTGDRNKLLKVTSWGGLEIMVGGFSGCENLDLSEVQGIPDNKVKVLRTLFKNCKNITQIKGLSSWDTSQVLNMAGMFENAVNFNQDISKLTYNPNVILEGFMSGKSELNFNAEYYDSFLKKLSESVINKGRAQENNIIDMGSIKYTETGEQYRNLLLQNGWTINDGGLK